MQASNKPDRINDSIREDADLDIVVVVTIKILKK